MRLTLASRQSDLARWQAAEVAGALAALPDPPKIEFVYKSSLGDDNLDVPLAEMPAKGVFTEDFHADLVGGRCDLVVHSWKDLPTEERAGSVIAMTLARADVRDVLLVPEAAWDDARRSGTLVVLTSSPRRVYNLGAALPRFWPGGVRPEFRPVRGNVPTRLAKMHAAGAALVLAKAGLGRLLRAEDANALSPGVSLRALIRGCRFQILPISVNPPAPAQGALAVEIARANQNLFKVLTGLNAAVDFASVVEERAILAGHGGGCHQKIGAAVLTRPYGRIRAVRGLTDRGEVLGEWSLTNQTPWARAREADAIFPHAARDNAWFDRRPIAAEELAPELAQKQNLYIARESALPAGHVPAPGPRVWTSGAKAWEALAARGVWVNGCHDGLGEAEPTGIESLTGPLRWTKLTHRSAAAAPAAADMDVLATYELGPKADAPDLRGKTHYFWMSPTSFARAAELNPGLGERGHHACGPGATLDYLRARARLARPPKAFIGLAQFLAESLPEGHA